MTKKLEPIVDYVYNLLTEQPPAPADAPDTAEPAAATTRRKTAQRGQRDKWETELASLIAKYKTGAKESWKDWLEDHPHQAEELADICLRNPNNPLCKKQLEPCPKETPFRCPDGSCVKTEAECPEGTGTGGGGAGDKVDIDVLIKIIQGFGGTGGDTITQNITQIVNDNDTTNIDNRQLVQQIIDQSQNFNINLKQKLTQVQINKIRQTLINQKIIVGQPGEPLGGGMDPGKPVLTLIKLDNDDIKYWRSDGRIQKTPKARDEILSLFVKAREQGVIGNNTEHGQGPLTSKYIGDFFDTKGRFQTKISGGELGNYNRIISAIAKNTPRSRLQVYFIIDASVYTDVARIINREEKDIIRPITRIAKTFLKRLVTSKGKAGRGMVSIDSAIKTIKWGFNQKIGDEELQGILSIFQTYGLVKGGGGRTIEPRKTQRRKGERRRVRENIDTFTDIIANILIKKFKK